CYSLSLSLCLSFLPSSRLHPHVHSFPTRRSSDLFPAVYAFHSNAVYKLQSCFKSVNTCYIKGSRFKSVGHKLGQGLKIGYASRVDRKSTRLNSSHVSISYAVFCLKKKKIYIN